MDPRLGGSGFCLLLAVLGGWSCETDVSEIGPAGGAAGSGASTTTSSSGNGGTAGSSTGGLGGAAGSSTGGVGGIGGAGGSSGGGGGAGGSGASDGTYTAEYWSGGLNHLIVLKADPVRNICVRLFAAWPTSNTPGFDFTMPQQWDQPWGVGSALVTNLATDCDTAMQQPVGETVQASGGSGAIDWVLGPSQYFPCELSIDAVLSFPAGPAWAPTSEPLLAQSVPVSGCG
jgi:hypothetical protein